MRHERRQDGDECGCALGAKFLVSSFVLSIAALWWQYGFITLAFARHLPIAVLIALLAGGVGKAIGITMARRRRSLPSQ